MKKSLPEQPLFSDDTKEKNPAISEDLIPEDIPEEEKRKTKTLEFCFKAAPWIALLAIVLIAGDVICQRYELKETLVEDGFSLITYIVTAALGYIFANNTNSH